MREGGVDREIGAPHVFRPISFTPDQFAGALGDSYSDLAALATAEHAVGVYQFAADYGFEAMAAGFLGGTVLERPPAQVGIAWSKRLIVIAPRGSSEFADWIGNVLSVRLVPWPDVAPEPARIGWGFRRQAEAIAGALLERIGQVLELCPDARIVVTGHSLGADLASKLTALLSAHGHQVAACWAHEAPRGGNEAWSRWYDERFTYGGTPTWSLVNATGGEPDLVTRVPRRAWGFRHLGRRVTLFGGQVYFGKAAWHAARAENPVGTLAAWRIISRTVRSVRAHYGAGLLEVLRARARDANVFNIRG